MGFISSSKDRSSSFWSLLDLNVTHLLLLILYLIMKEDYRLKVGFEYIEGDDQTYTYANILSCCGDCMGWFKAWIPCCGCFCCCCDDPFIQIPQGSKGILTKFQKYHQTCNSGLHYVNPISEKMNIIDCRIIVKPLPVQRLMTKDNIAVTVDSCMYYHVAQPHLMFYRVDNLQGSLAKAVGGLIKNSVTSFTFQDLLQKKQELTQDITKQVQPTVKHWGIIIDNVLLKNFGISKDLQSELVSAPIARRNAESKILNAQGQVQIAKMLAERSKILDSKTAIQVRYLETLKSLGRNQQSCMIYRSY